MPPPVWAPEVADVGAVLRARTKDNLGNELGTFTANTQPTAVQVQSLLTPEAERHAGIVPLDKVLPVSLEPQARYLTALGTALLVEASYFPEQVASGRSPWAQLKELYDSALEAFRAALAAEGIIPPPDAPAALVPPPPSFLFPAGIPAWMSDPYAW